jgi:predicted amino acid racemase
MGTNERMSDDELVVVYTTQGALRAEIIKGKLESAGIPAIVKVESQNVIPMTVDGIGKAEVLVSKEREQEARAVLET